MLRARCSAQDPNVAARHARGSRPRASGAASSSRTENPVFQQMYSGRRAVGTEPAAARRPAARDVADACGSSGCSCRATAKVKRPRPRAAPRSCSLQAPIIGVLLALVFGGQKTAIPFWCLGALQELAKKSTGSGERRRRTCSNAMHADDRPHGGDLLRRRRRVWFGTSNAAREIVSERAIYLRERMVNLSLFNYVLSKFILLSLVLHRPVHGAARHRLLRARLPRRPAGVRRSSSATMIALAMNATALGLLALDAWSRRPRRRWRSRRSRSSRRSSSAA